MKILQVTHRYPPQVGGVETHVKEISERLADRGHEVTVFSADAGMEGKRREVRNGVTVRRFRSFAPGGAFYAAPGIVPAVRRADVDVVHAHNYHALPALAAAMGVRDARFVFTTHYHGWSASSVRDRLLRAYRVVGRWAVTDADTVIAVSEWERDLLREDFDVEATVIPNGLRCKRFANAEPESRERPYLLCVGRLEGYKRVQHAIRALKELPKYDLLVVGEGPYRPQLENVAREASVAERVEFIGFADHDWLPGLYAGADIFVNLSEFEAYGMTVAEALAAGTPCLVWEGGALGGWVAEDGVVGVDALDSSSIAAACRSSAGTDTMRPSLPTWDEVTERLLEVYRG